MWKKKAKKTPKKLDIPEVYKDDKKPYVKDHNYSGYGMSDNNFEELEEKQITPPQEKQFGNYGLGNPAQHFTPAQLDEEPQFGSYGSNNNAPMSLPGQNEIEEPQYGTYSSPTAASDIPVGQPSQEEPQYGLYGSANISNQMPQAGQSIAEEPQYGSYGSPSSADETVVMQNVAEEPKYGTYGSASSSNETAVLPNMAQEPQYGSYGSGNQSVEETQILQDNSIDNLPSDNGNVAGHTFNPGANVQPQFGDIDPTEMQQYVESAPLPEEPQYGSYGANTTPVHNINQDDIPDPQFGIYGSNGSDFVDELQDILEPEPIQEEPAIPQPTYGTYGTPASPDQSVLVQEFEQAQNGDYNQNKEPAQFQQIENRQISRYGAYGSTKAEIEQARQVPVKKVQTQSIIQNDVVPQNVGNVYENDLIQNNQNGLQNVVSQSLDNLVQDGKIVLPEFLAAMEVDANQLQMILGVITKDRDFSFKYIKPSNDFKVLYFCDQNNHLVPLPIDRIIEVRDILFSIINKGK